MGLREDALRLHLSARGKISVRSKVPVRDSRDLSLAYSPGVAEPCLEIVKDASNLNRYTNRGNMVAVVTNGTAVLGMGDIGARAALPVMEGKCVLFKSFAGVDAFPICLDTRDNGKIVETVRLLEPTFGGVNLEDIAAPDCFEIEERLKELCGIPIFHDDQHGTAIVTMAGLLNGLKLVGKRLKDARIVISGAGAAGMAIVKLLMSMGLENAVMCDSAGAIYEGRAEGMNAYKTAIAKRTNRERQRGGLADVIAGADVFIGVSIAGAVTPQMVKSMARDAIIFAMANPVPEIMPEEAIEAGAAVVGTGRSDYPNQVNNVLAFPGVFRGALDTEARRISEEMKLAAARAIAGLVSAAELRPGYVIPLAFDPRVAPAVARAVAKAAIDTGAARQTPSPEEVARNVGRLINA